MDKNRIEGRHGATSWHNTAKSSGLPVEVNAAVVQGSSAPLPGEIPRRKCRGKSAEAIVVAETSRSAQKHSKIAGGLTRRRAEPMKNPRPRGGHPSRHRPTGWGKGECRHDGKHGGFWGEATWARVEVAASEEGLSRI